MRNISAAMKTGDNLIIGIQTSYNFNELLKKYQTPELQSIAEPMLKKLGLKKESAEIVTTGDEAKKEIYQNVRILREKEIIIGKNKVNLPTGKMINLIISHKYEIPEMEHLAQTAGLNIKKTFINKENSYGIFVLEK